MQVLFNVQNYILLVICVFHYPQKNVYSNYYNAKKSAVQLLLLNYYEKSTYKMSQNDRKVSSECKDIHYSSKRSIYVRVLGRVYEHHWSRLALRRRSGRPGLCPCPRQPNAIAITIYIYLWHNHYMSAFRFLVILYNLEIHIHLYIHNLLKQSQVESKELC